MALRPIRLIGDDVLRKKAKKVERVNDFIRTLLDDMADTMYKHDGVGLAGNQIGVLKRVIVVDDGEGLLQLVNPVITEQSGSQTGTEGCLSLPDIYGDVERYDKITVKALDHRGIKVKIEAEGYLARILQHEIDHLEGKVFIDTASNIHEEKAASSKEIAEDKESNEEAVKEKSLSNHID